MKAYVDNEIIRKMKEVTGENGIKKNIFLEACIENEILKQDQALEISWGWPSFLEYIDTGFLFKIFPKFDEEHKLFNLIITSLDFEKELLIRLYDQIFVENLTQVKAIPQIHQTYLLNQIQQKRHSFLFLYLNEFFNSEIEYYEKSLKENPYNILHDLTLYLAWDRVCVNVAAILEYPYPEHTNINSLELFKECLIESFQHITAQKRTKPSFFRLIEALYALQMREENLQEYTDLEWQILSKGSSALRFREDLADVYYIDAAIIDLRDKLSDPIENPALMVFTMDSEEKVRAGLSLAYFMIQKLKNEISGWHYGLMPVEVICMKESQNGFYVHTRVKGEGAI